MNKSIMPYLICPDCNSGDLKLEAYSFADGVDLDEGRIICPSCGGWYRIERGIADLLPAHLRRVDINAAFEKRHGLKAGNGRPKGEAAGDSGQIDFFKENAADYESRVVNGKYYKALDRIAFLDWVDRNFSMCRWVLDIGSGTGRQCIPLAQHGIRTIGIDISEEMLTLAREKICRLKLGGYVDLIVADAKNPPVKNGFFDACIFYGTLHHLSDPGKAIENASKKIKKGGLFFSLDPHASPLRFLFDLTMKIYKLYDEKASDNPLLSEVQLKKWLSAAGIRPVTRLSTYIPPHLFYMLNAEANIKLLKISDSFFNRTRLLRNIAGVIMSEGVKE